MGNKKQLILSIRSAAVFMLLSGLLLATICFSGINVFAKEENTQKKAVDILLNFMEKNGDYIGDAYEWSDLPDEQSMCDLVYDEEMETVTFTLFITKEDMESVCLFRYDINSCDVDGHMFMAKYQDTAMRQYELGTDEFDLSVSGANVYKVKISAEKDVSGINTDKYDKIMTDLMLENLWYWNQMLIRDMGIGLGDLGFVEYDSLLEEPVEEFSGDVQYSSHVQGIGWQQWAANGDLSGTSGQSKRIEGIKIRVSGVEGLGVRYTTHCQTYGWVPWSKNGEMSGTEGESKRVEALRIQLIGKNAELYDIWYRVHVQNFGWLAWTKNGEIAGSMGLSKRIEGIQIVVKNKGDASPGNQGGFISAYMDGVQMGPGANPNSGLKGQDDTSVAVITHVQTYGWNGWKYNGAVAGTSGESKRVEALKIRLMNQKYSGDIEYRSHVQREGWQNWFGNGNLSGTSGESKRIEAIEIRLTGEMEQHYDIYYRVHVQKFGWLGWAKNGERAGTAGYSYRMEALQVVLVPKEESAEWREKMGIHGEAAFVLK